MKAILLLVVLTFATSKNPCKEVFFWRRATIFGKPDIEEIKSPAGKVFLADTGGKTCDKVTDCVNLVRALRIKDVKRGFADIQDNFYIGGDGDVYIGLDWNAKNLRYKDHANDMSVVFIGNFTKKSLPQQMITTARNLILCGQQIRHLDYYYSVYSANDLVCPNGSSNNSGIDEEIQKWTTYGLDGKLLDCHSLKK